MHPTRVMVDVGGVREARTDDDDDEQPTLDVVTKVWEVGLLPVSDKVQRSLQPFIDSASAIPVTTSPLARFQCQLGARPALRLSWDEVVASLDIPDMAFRVW